MIYITDLFCPLIKDKCNTNCAFLNDETGDVCQLALSAKAMTDYVTIFQRMDESLKKINSHLNSQNQSSED